MISLSKAFGWNFVHKSSTYKSLSENIFAQKEIHEMDTWRKSRTLSSRPDRLRREAVERSPAVQSL
jgi:hypothetical protein